MDGVQYDIALILAPRFPLLSLAICTESLRVANRELGRGAFSRTLVSLDGFTVPFFERAVDGAGCGPGRDCRGAGGDLACPYQVEAASPVPLASGVRTGRVRCWPPWTTPPICWPQRG